MQNDTERDDRSKVPWSHHNGRAIHAEYVGQTHAARLAGITQAVQDGSYDDTDPVRVAVTVERMLEEGRY
jgi:hypothetical protein